MFENNESKISPCPGMVYYFGMGFGGRTGRLVERISSSGLFHRRSGSDRRYLDGVPDLSFAGEVTTSLIPF